MIDLDKIYYVIMDSTDGALIGIDKESSRPCKPSSIGLVAFFSSIELSTKYRQIMFESHGTFPKANSWNIYEFTARSGLGKKVL